MADDQQDLREHPAHTTKSNPAPRIPDQPCFLTNNDIPQSPALAGTFESPSAGIHSQRLYQSRNYSLQTDSGYSSEKYSSSAISSFHSVSHVPTSIASITETSSYELDHKLDDFQLCIQSPSSSPIQTSFFHDTPGRLQSPYSKVRIDLIDFLTKKHSLEDILCHIFSYLSAKDLRNITQVSRSWRSFVKQDTKLRKRFQSFQSHARGAYKENEATGSNGKSSVERTRSLLGESQYLQTPPNQVSPATTHNFIAQSTPSRMEEAKRTLLTRSDHLLRQCPKCKSPARVDPRNNLGECSSDHCQTRFCSRCLGPYHDASPCITISPRKRNATLIGSKSSKRNLKRLLI